MFLARPLPAYAPDAPIKALEPAELFVLCIARLWVLHHRQPETVAADWRAGFAHMHMDGNSQAGFDALFATVAASAVRSIDIRCKTCPHLGEDEAWLLQLVSLLQQGGLAEAAAILAGWLPPNEVRQAIGPAHVFAAGLAARGLTVPLRPPAEAASAPPAMARIHACTSDALH
jgi:hypothetical protein